MGIFRKFCYDFGFVRSALFFLRLRWCNDFRNCSLSCFTLLFRLFSTMYTCENAGQIRRHCSALCSGIMSRKCVSTFDFIRFDLIRRTGRTTRFFAPFANGHFSYKHLHWSELTLQTGPCITPLRKMSSLSSIEYPFRAFFVSTTALSQTLFYDC